jgi:hypothetical protein
VNQPDNEKQTQQEAPAEPLKVRTSVQAGRGVTFRGGSDGITLGSESATESLGIPVYTQQSYHDAYYNHP